MTGLLDSHHLRVGVQTVPTNSISDQQSIQIAISLVLRFPNSQKFRLPGTASMRSLLPPHFGQLQIRSVMFIHLLFMGLQNLLITSCINFAHFSIYLGVVHVRTSHKLCLFFVFRHSPYAVIITKPSPPTAWH